MADLYRMSVEQLQRELLRLQGELEQQRARARRCLGSVRVPGVGRRHGTSRMVRSRRDSAGHRDADQRIRVLQADIRLVEVLISAKARA